MSFDHALFKITGDVSGAEKLRKLMFSALDRCKATIVEACEHQYTPYGITCVFVLSESHAVLSTWQEFNFALVDYFSCAEEPNIPDFVQEFVDNGFKVEDFMLISR